MFNLGWWKNRAGRLDEEMRQHIELETEANIEAGMSPTEAHYAALKKFGNRLIAQEDSHETWGWFWLERLLQDIRYGLRGFARSTGFTAVALLSLALGVGASTSLFSAVYGILVAPYPYAKPNEIWAPAVDALKDKPRGWHQYSLRQLGEIRKLSVFADAMATDLEPVLLNGDSGPERFNGVLLTGEAFHFIGVKPLIGRTIQPFDIRPDGQAEPVVVLTFKLWQRLFNGDVGALGKKLVLNDVPHTVIGVMPPRFGWHTDEAFWLPMPDVGADDRMVNAIVRLTPGVSKEAAGFQLQSLNLQFAAAKPKEFPKTAFKTTLLNYMDLTSISDNMIRSLHLLLVAVGLLLLIACVNVANLQLARTTARAREIAVRLSIGATRGRLVRQLLTESVILSLFGGVLGVLFAEGATRAIAVLIPANYVPNEARITVNGQVLLFSLAISVLTGILFGLAPAIRCSRPNLADSLKDGGRGTAGSHRGQKMRSWLVIAEVGLSVILLAGASIAIRSFSNLLSLDPGFQPQKSLTMSIALPPKRYGTLAQRNEFAAKLLENLSALPGVTAAALGNGGMPFGGPRTAYQIPGRQPQDDRFVVLGLISQDYPKALGIPLKRGRQFTAQEIASGSHVALVNQTAVKLWQANLDPIGSHIHLNVLSDAPRGVLAPTGADGDLTIIGILADTRNAGLRNDTLPSVLVPYTLLAPPVRVLSVRTAGEPLAMTNAVRKTIQGLDKDLPLGRVSTLQEVLGIQTMEPRFSMALFSCFAGLGLILAAIGLYSVISYDVSQRMHELGVRIALGASRSDVLAIVLGQGAKLLGFGLLIGLISAVVLERIVRFQMFASSSFDLLSLASVVFVLALVAFIACWRPARRAGRLDPVSALRHEA